MTAARPSSPGDEHLFSPKRHHWSKIRCNSPAASIVDRSASDGIGISLRSASAIAAMRSKKGRPTSGELMVMSWER